MCREKEEEKIIRMRDEKKYAQQRIFSGER